MESITTITYILQETKMVIASGHAMQILMEGSASPVAERS